VSRQIIQDIVIPIVARIMADDGYMSSREMFDLRDPVLEEFLEEELRRRFGIVGANGCQHLKEQLEQARKNDPFEFDQIVRQILEKYVKLQVKIRHPRKAMELEDGPPDRFSKQRRRYPLLGYLQ
jgi:hypothetical protein